MDDTPGVSDEPKFLTVKQSSRRLNVSVGCVYRLCSTGKLPHYKFGDGQGAVRIARDDLLAFVRGCRVEKGDADAETGKPGRRTGTEGGYDFKHLDVRPKHACGAMTKAGTPCTVPTRGERCRRHTTKGK
jgi:excisionase family DNA binding protein